MTESDQHLSHVVVVGASAGGIESISLLLEQLPRDFPAPIVIAQHISPSRESALTSILARRCALPVKALLDTTDLEPGTVHIVPENRNAQFEGQRIHLTIDGNGPLPSIDLLFSSAAEAFGESVIAVVLSGTGSDGAAGARDVKYAGGTVVIQDPDSAAFPAMPLSLAPSIVDITATPERLGALLVDLVSGEYAVAAPDQSSQMRLFLEELREQSGIDFSTYKQGTIERRLHRRMLATGTESPADYIRYVRDHPEEGRRLVGDFLIKVTGFFRDPDLFAYLRDQVLPELTRRAADHDGELRFWSAGCATGEEAYSLAMVVQEALGDNPDRIRVKIFATDLDDQAVAYARRGIYPARAIAELTPAQRDRHFVRYGDDYEVRKELRSLIVFGEHDLAQRAPFPRIDLVLCRNVLIYFTAALQRRALQLFAFSLKPSGYLVLGKSETVTPLGEYFAVDHSRLKVFRRVGARAVTAPMGSREVRMTTGAMSGDASPLRRSTAITSMIGSLGRNRGQLQGRGSTLRGERLLLELPIGVVIVNQQYDVQHINTEARRLLGIHTTAMNDDLIHQVRHFDAIALRGAIDRSRRSNDIERIVLETIDTPEEARRYLEVACHASPEAEESSDQYIILTIADVTDRENLRSEVATAQSVLDRLTNANEELVAANHQLTQTVTGLRAENDDLLLAAEEIQAAAEEVETLNEELQASNEELETLNEELQATVEELNTTNDDLENRSLELQEMALESEMRQQRLRAVIDALDDPMVVLNATQAVVIENAAYRDLCGPGINHPSLNDAEGLPFTTAANPYMRAANGEAFTMTVTCDGELRTLRVQQATSGAGERLAVITIERTRAS